MSQYAPEYTRKERVRIVAKQLLLVAPLFLLSEFWLFDWIETAAENNACVFGFQFSRVHMIFYGLFVGIPLLLAFTLLLLEGRRSFKVFKLGQNPLPGEKVFRKTRYRYGTRAKIKPFLLLCTLIALVIFASWGSKQAERITQDLAPCIVQAL